MNITLGDILFTIWVLVGIANMVLLTYHTDGFCKDVERLGEELRKTNDKENQ